MVINRKKDTDKTAAKQGVEAVISEPHKIGAFTPFDFDSRNLTAYGGLLPVATMLERLQFQQLVEETLTVKRVPRSMSMYQFVLAMVLAAYVGFSRLYHLRFIAREPMLTGILKILRLPPQCTFWRFLASLHLGIAKQLLTVQRHMRERVWQAAHVGLTAVTLDTDTTVHTLFGKQMGGRKGYNPKNKGKKSYQPILTFLAEAYNLNCWLMLLHREEQAQVATLKHVTLESPPALSVSRGQNLASRRQSWRQLQRSLSGTRNISAVDGPIAGDHARRAAVPPGAGDRTEGIATCA